MRKTIYLFFISFFWGCLQEDSPPEVLSPGNQQRHGLALLFQQKLEKLPVSRTSKTATSSEQGTPLLEHVRVGRNAIYGGLYFIVPLQNSRGQIDAGLVYPLMGNDTISGFDLSGDLGSPSVVDEHVINEVSDRGQRFLLSNKFLAWKKEGLSVASSLYAYAESLDGKHVYRPNPNRVRSKSSMDNLIAEVFIDYEIDPNDEVVFPSPDGGVIATFLSTEDINQIFSDALGILSYRSEILSYDFRGSSFSHTYLILEVNDESVIADAVNEYINEVASLFDDRFNVNDIPFYFHYVVNESSPSPSPDPGEGGDVGGSNVGEGEGGGTADGENNDGGGTSGTKSPVELMDVSKFVAYNKFNDCYRACTLIMQNYGFPYGSRSHVYLLRTEDQTTGELHLHGDNPADKYAKALACIDRHLDANPPRPIVIGLNEEPFRRINDGATDHFVVVTGRGYDESKGMYYYTYMETGVSNVRDGCNIEKNRLYYDPENLNFEGESDSRDYLYEYDVTQVRPNDGKNLEETETYELVNQ